MDIFDEMAAKWPSSVVARSEAKNFSGGIVSGKSLANMDSLGLGPIERFIVSGKVCYPVAILASWLRGRTKKAPGVRG